MTEKHPEKVDAIEWFPKNLACLWVATTAKVREQCFPCKSTNIVRRLGPHN